MTENEDVRKLLEGVIPERIHEVMRLVSTYAGQFRKVGDKPGFHLNAGAYSAVQYTYRSMQQLWLFGYAGMLSLHCYSGLIFVIQSLGLTLNLEEIEKLPGQRKKDVQFSNLINSICELSEAGSEMDFTWPLGIPTPEEGRSINIEHAAVFDLTCMATAYTFLHELKHVIFSAQNNAPESPLDEEYACDSFAREMMMGRIDQYAQVSGYPSDKVKMKRSSGIALASVFLLFATAKQSVGGSATHPPVHGRWLAALESNDLPENDFYWLYFSSLALAMLKHREIPFPVLQVEDFKGLSQALIRALENSI